VSYRCLISLLLVTGGAWAPCHAKLVLPCLVRTPLTRRSLFTGFRWKERPRRWNTKTDALSRPTNCAETRGGAGAGERRTNPSCGGASFSLTGGCCFFALGSSSPQGCSNLSPPLSSSSHRFRRTLLFSRTFFLIAPPKRNAPMQSSGVRQFVL
jgi:hypothetical protein